MSVTSIRLQKELEPPLNELAKKLDRSKNWLINQAVREFLANRALEEKRWAETVEALASVQSGDVVQSEDVHDWLKSWGEESELDPPRG